MPLKGKIFLDDVLDQVGGGKSDVVGAGNKQTVVQNNGHVSVKQLRDLTRSLAVVCKYAFS